MFDQALLTKLLCVAFVAAVIPPPPARAAGGVSRGRLVGLWGCVYGVVVCILSFFFSLFFFFSFFSSFWGQRDHSISISYIYL